MRQVWRHLGFLHWPIASAAIAPLLPPGLSVDTFDGVAYLGLVPFTIPLSRTPRLGLPVAPAFHELNLRTYVHRDGRDPGVWFFSLDAASRLAVAGARLGYHLPYFHARISLEISDGPIDFIQLSPPRLRSDGGVLRPLRPHRSGGAGGGRIARVLPGRALSPLRLERTHALERPRPSRAVPAAASRRLRGAAVADRRRGPPTVR